MFAFAQLSTHACDSDTVALLQTPGPNVTEPRSRSCSLVSSSGLTLLVVTAAITVAARAGAVTATRPASSNCMCTSLVKFRPNWIPVLGKMARPGGVQPKWLNFG